MQHLYHAPNTVMVPDLRQQHDVDLMAAITRGDELVGNEVSVAYSPVRHLGVGARSYFSGRRYIGENPGPFYRFFQWEALLGGYYPIAEDGELALLANTYVTYTSGRISNFYEDGEQTFSRLHYRRWSLMPGLRFQAAWFEIAISGRFSQFGFHRAVLHGDITEKNLADIETAIAKPVFVMEPYMSIGVGEEGLRLYIALMGSYPQRSIKLPYEDVMFTAGVQLRLSRQSREELNKL